MKDRRPKLKRYVREGHPLSKVNHGVSIGTVKG